MTMTEPAETQKNTFEKRIINALIIGLIVIVSALLLMSLALHEPGAYQPVPAETGGISPYITHKLAPEVFLKVQLDNRFEIIVEQDGLNDIVARLDWPRQSGKATIQQPVATLDPNGLSVMAKVHYLKLPVVLTVKARPEILEDGRLVFNLRTVRAGKIPVTPIARMIIAKALDDEIEKLGGKIEAPDTNVLKKLYYTKTRDTLVALKPALLENEPMDPSFPVSRTKRIHLDAVEFNSKAAVLRFTPAKLE